MSIFSRYPYTDFHRLNADWILDKVKDAMASVAESLGLVRQSAADAAAAAAAAQQAVDGSVRYDRAQELSADQKLQARNNIDAAPSVGVVRYNVAMALDNSYQAQARTNIGAAANSDLQVLNQQVVKTVSQQLTELKQATARGNIGAAAAADLTDAVQGLEDVIDLVSRTASNCVRYDGAQGLTQAQQAQARANIGAAAEGSTPAPAGAVLYDRAQSLTGVQKNQARANIGAAAQTDPNLIHSIELVDDAAAGNEGDELTVTLTSVVDQSKVLLAGQQSDNVILSGLAAPVEDNDAANKAYVQSSLLKTVTVTGTTPVIDLANEIDGSSYETIITCTGTPSTVTISTAINSPMLATIVFTTGAAAPTFDSPLTILGLDDLVPEANTTYEISIRSNRAVWKAWEVSA